MILSSAMAGVALISSVIPFAMAQEVYPLPTPKGETTWRDLGFSQVPEGLSNDLIPLFEGLNEARGAWSLEGETVGVAGAEPLEARLQIVGAAESGMFPVWNMTVGWPAEEPELSILYNVMAAPSENGFDLMLIRAGPVEGDDLVQDRSEMRPEMFEGTWNLEDRALTWTERESPAGFPGQPEEEGDSQPKQSFEMIVATNGKIYIKNSKNAPPGQLTRGAAIVRTGAAPTGPLILTGDHQFKTANHVLDGRIRPWLPPQANEISLFSARNGHYARYRVAEEHFMKFVDGLWEADQGASAHQRDEMAGEGEPGNPRRIAERLRIGGEQPQGEFRVYHSPSTRSAAMTTYFFNRETGIAYHDRGYW